MRREMRRQLARRAAAVDEAPDDAVLLTCLVDLDERNILLWCQRDIAHVLATARDEEVLARKARHRITNWLPRLDLVQRLLDGFDLFRLDAVRQVAAIALMPTFLEGVGRQALEAFHELRI